MARHTTKVGKYVLGETLGEGTFGKVKRAKRADTGADGFAVRIIDRKRVAEEHNREQIKREIKTLKLLRHPNVVRLYEVMASKTKIYMVLELVTGGELFDKIDSQGNLSEDEGRRLFQQIIDAVSYCHDQGVYHRDLKPENILIDEKGNIKISDFGVSALPPQFGADGLLHTTCGSPNYVAPEVLANHGYEGAKADIWSCGVILYVILTGCFPFDDDNLAALYQKISKGAAHIPDFMSKGASHMIKRILDPNPKTRITMAQIKADNWFKQGYAPAVLIEEDDSSSDEEGCGCGSGFKEISEVHEYSQLNAFELIGMSWALDLSGLFEDEDVSENKIRFNSSRAPKDDLDSIEAVATVMGYEVHKNHSKLKIDKNCKGPNSPSSLHVTVEIFELGTSLYVVELRKTSGDAKLYKALCKKILHELGVCNNRDISKENMVPELTAIKRDGPISVGLN